MELQHKKICTEQELITKLHGEKQAGRRIVFTNGCFDIIHPGHVDLLSRAKSLGDILVLGLNTDTSVQSLNKGSDRPIVPFAARAFVLAHLSSVDFICGFDSETPLELIQRVCPDVLVKGGDWALESIVGGDFVSSYGGEIVSLPLIQGYSTTNIVEKIRNYSSS